MNDSIICTIQGTSPAAGLTVDQFRELVRNEVRLANSVNGAVEKLVDAEEVATLLGLELKLVYAMARKKKIPAIKIGKYWKFSLPKLRKWIEQQHNC